MTHDKMNNPIDKLVHELNKLPGVGEKTALRYALFVLRQDKHYAESLVRAVQDVKEKVQLCSSCYSLTEQDPCNICSDQKRDSQVLCILEEPSDLLAVEKTGVFRGLYHVLHGALSPLDGIGPEDLKIVELMRRLEAEAIEEVVLATNVNIEGEATALYLSRLIKPSGIRMSRLASGIPVGGALEYIDASTLTRAFEERNVL